MSNAFMILFLCWRNCHSCWSDFHIVAQLLYRCCYNIYSRINPLPEWPSCMLSCSNLPPCFYFTVFSHWYFQLHSILSHYGCLLHFLFCFATSKCTLHLFFTIFHSLILSTTFCFIAFRDIYGILFYVACFQLMIPHTW